MKIDQTETKNLMNEFPEVAEGLEAEWETWIK